MTVILLGAALRGNASISVRYLPTKIILRRPNDNLTRGGSLVSLTGRVDGIPVIRRSGLSRLVFRPRVSGPVRLRYLSTTRFATFIRIGRVYRTEGWVMAPSMLALHQKKNPCSCSPVETQVGVHLGGKHVQGLLLSVSTPTA
jgi:hypothetical protein